MASVPGGAGLRPKGRNRPRQRARVAFGLCPDCGEDDAAPGGLRCAVCRDQQNERHREIYRQQRAAGLPRYDAATLQQKAASVRRKRAERQARKRCIQCGAAVAKFQRCMKCRAKNAAANRRWKLKRKQPIGVVWQIED